MQGSNASGDVQVVVDFDPSCMGWCTEGSRVSLLKGNLSMWLRGRRFPLAAMVWLIVLRLVLGASSIIAQSGLQTPGSAATTPARPSDAPQPPAPVLRPTIVHSAGYVVPRVEALATIFHAVEERQSLSAGDHVVINIGTEQQVHVGDWFTIIRHSSSIRHPVSDQPIGTLVTTLGYATAVRVQASATILRIAKTFDSVELGDHVTRFETPQPQDSAATASSAGREIKGMIIEAKDAKVSVGEGDIVYLDVGQQAGVRIGDRFNVFQEGDMVRHPITRRLLRLPRQVFGTLTVLDVREHTATAVVLSSRRELSAGAPIQLQVTEERPPTEARLHSEDPTAKQIASLQTALVGLLPCLDAAREALRAAETAGVPPAELASAKSALASAEQQLELAKTALAQGDVEQARRYLAVAQADCLTAQDLSLQASTSLASRPATDHYTVQSGDTLWGISEQATIYQNPLLWPMLYNANRDHIRDPDLIFPDQRFTVPRNYSQEGADTARQRARRRGPWRLGDGPDRYILEGVRP